MTQQSYTTFKHQARNVSRSYGIQLVCTLFRQREYAFVQEEIADVDEFVLVVLDFLKHLEEHSVSLVRLFQLLFHDLLRHSSVLSGQRLSLIALVVLRLCSSCAKKKHSCQSETVKQFLFHNLLFFFILFLQCSSTKPKVQVLRRAIASSFIRNTRLQQAD